MPSAGGSTAPASSSHEPQVNAIQKQNEELKQRNAELQLQLEIQRAASSKPPPNGYKAVPLTSRPFAEPFLWPTRPLKTTAADLSYAKRIREWAGQLDVYMFDEVQYMQAEMAARAEMEKRWNEEQAAGRSTVKREGNQGGLSTEAPQPQGKKRKGAKTES